jgi:hypothetical protein
MCPDARQDAEQEQRTNSVFQPLRVVVRRWKVDVKQSLSSFFGSIDIDDERPRASDITR